MHKGNASEKPSGPQRQACPFCGESIRTDAKKCRYCGEYLRSAGRLQHFGRRTVTFIGVVTAALSLFYALREGYFYIDKQQRQRSELASYTAVASQFESIDSLEYAEKALIRALELSPSDVELQRRLFILQADKLLRDINWAGAEPEIRAQVSALVLEGYRLLDVSSEKSMRSRLLVLVARLLPQDMLWKDEDGITALYRRAYELTPQHAEVNYHYGGWLIDAELDQQQGMALLEASVKLAPGNAMYAWELGRIYLEQADYRSALPLLQAAVALQPSQKKIQHVRAANDAKRQLRQLLIDADKQEDITTEEFLGLDLPAKRALIRQALDYRPTDRTTNLVVARFHYALDELGAAEEAIQHAVSDDDLKHTIRGYYLKEFELYRDILKRSDSDPSRLEAIEMALEQYRIASEYSEALEWGIKGRHRYKVGLRIRKPVVNRQLEVLKSYSGYPFAKAGIREGDLILEIAHRTADSMVSLGYILDNFNPGTTIPVLIERDGEQQELQLLIE